MPAIHGANGKVKVGGNAVARVTNFDLTEEAPTSDTTAMGDEWGQHIVGAPKRWSGSLTCRYDPTDTTGQGALTAGAQVALALYPESDALGASEKSGAATITGVNYTESYTDVVEISFDFQGNGELTTTTVVA